MSLRIQFWHRASRATTAAGALLPAKAAAATRTARSCLPSSPKPVVVTHTEAHCSTFSSHCSRREQLTGKNSTRNTSEDNTVISTPTPTSTAPLPTIPTIEPAVTLALTPTSNSWTAPTTIDAAAMPFVHPTPKLASTSTPSPNPISIPQNFLTGPCPDPKLHKLDFPSINLPEYAPHFALLIDGALSASECRQLVSLAEATTESTWERAMVNVGGGQQAMISDVRNCDRIIWDSTDVTGRIWERVRPYVEGYGIGKIANMPLVTGYGPVKRKETAKVVGLNERMRILKYTGGEYFREHFDGQYRTPDGSEFSLFTLHLYLNESTSDNEIVGGATTFISPEEEGRPYNVEPKIGRILIFQHRGLLHAGEEVTSGIKMTMRTDVMYKNVEK